MRGGKILLYCATILARNTDLIQKPLRPPHDYFRISDTFAILDIRIKNSNSSVLCHFYKAESRKKSKRGRAPNEEKAKSEAAAKMEDTHEAFPRELTNVLHMAESLPQRPDGAVSYTTRYRQSSTWCKGRPFADGVAMAKVPRVVRATAYRDLGVRDWHVSMA